MTSNTCELVYAITCFELTCAALGAILGFIYAADAQDKRLEQMDGDLQYFDEFYSVKWAAGGAAIGTVTPIALLLFCAGCVRTIRFLDSINHSPISERTPLLEILSPSLEKGIENTEDDTPDAPDEFLCPITYELMENPIELNCGHIFEAKSIDKIERNPVDGCLHCPMCRTVISSQTHNELLKKQIEEYKNTKTNARENNQNNTQASATLPTEGTSFSGALIQNSVFAPPANSTSNTYLEHHKKKLGLSSNN